MHRDYPPFWALEGQLLGVGGLVILKDSQLSNAYYLCSRSRASCYTNHAQVGKWEVFTLELLLRMVSWVKSELIQFSRPVESDSLGLITGF